MSRRLFIAFLLSLPFIWFGAFAYAAWQDPLVGVTPPAGNLSGPVWFLPDIGAEQQVETGANPGINISGTILTTGNIKSTVGKILAPQGKFNIDDSSGAVGSNSSPIIGAVNTTNNFAVQGLAGVGAAGGGGVYGLGYGNPSLATPTGAWAGYFSGYLYADWLCLADSAGDADSDKDCIDSWEDVASAIIGTSDTFWNREGTTKNIFKAAIDGSLDGIVGIGTITPSTAGFASGTRLGIVGETGKGPRLYLSKSTGNPEIDLQISDGSQWAIYTSTTAAVSEKDQLRFWQGSDRVVFTKTGNVGIGTTAPGAALHVNSGTASETALILQQSVTANYPDIFCKNNLGNNNLCEFKSGIYNNGAGFYSQNQIYARAGILNDTASTMLSLNDADGVLFSGPLYGSIAASGNITIRSTANATKGNILLADQGGNVGIGTATPQAALHLAGTTPVMVFDGWPILNTLTLTVSGSGSVTDNMGIIVNCSAICTGSYASGTTVIFTATPQGGATFNGWGGACAGAGANPTCSLIISGAASLSASFSAAPPSVITNSATVDSETTATLRATAYPKGLSATTSFRYSTSSVGVCTSAAEWYAGTPATASLDGTTFLRNLTGLANNTTYYFCARITIGGTNYTGGQKSFMTGAPG